MHLDAFLDYNRDPAFMERLTRYRLTIVAQELLKVSGLSKAELQRRLGTSASQLERLFDPANQAKTIDKVIRLIAAMGADVSVDAKSLHTRRASLSFKVRAA